MAEISKEFKTVLIVDWKKGTFRCTKKQRQLKPTEIPIHLKIKAIVPETPIYEATGEIKIAFPKVKEIMIDSLDDKESK